MKWTSGFLRTLVCPKYVCALSLFSYTLVLLSRPLEILYTQDFLLAGVNPKSNLGLSQPFTHAVLRCWIPLVHQRIYAAAPGVCYPKVSLPPDSPRLAS